MPDICRGKKRPRAADSIKWKNQNGTKLVSRAILSLSSVSARLRTSWRHEGPDRLHLSQTPCSFHKHHLEKNVEVCESMMKYATRFCRHQSERGSLETWKPASLLVGVCSSSRFSKGKNLIFELIRTTRMSAVGFVFSEIEDQAASCQRGTLRRRTPLWEFFTTLTAKPRCFSAVFSGASGLMPFMIMPGMARQSLDKRITKRSFVFTLCCQ